MKKQNNNENSENDFFKSFFAQYEVKNFRDLRKLALVKLIELSESDNRFIRIKALEILSKYCFDKVSNTADLFRKNNFPDLSELD